ncbi:MAG: ribonuclease J [Bdellovibrionales bacterium]
MDKFFDKESTFFVPLGGSGEIGSNLNLYGYQGKWLMLDCGVSFGDGIPGIDTTLPDPGFIVERRDDLVALVLTHGHEDHLGAIEYIWDQIQCPIYATPFTAALLRLKLGQGSNTKRVRIIEMNPGDRRTLGPFTFEFVAVTHSIPDSVMVIIETPTGRILHTGDWKFDPDPLLGHTTDFSRLKEIGAQGVLAAIGDSTNAMIPGHSGSEAEVKQVLIDVVKTQRQRVAITCFASNVARLRIAAEAARQSERQLAFIGRSLWRIHEAAVECGYWDYPQPVDPEDAGFLPPAHALYVVTGCQGEPRAALHRLAEDNHRDVVLDPGDTVIFSSRDIPGNEEEIAKLQHKLREAGMVVLTLEDAPVHVSGHPAQAELAELYQMTRPQIVIPVHGEPPHQRAHADLAIQCQVRQTLIPTNGDIVKISRDKAEKVGTVPFGKLGVAGKKLISVKVDPSRHHGGS